MPDIYFTCKTCGKCLVADDTLTGQTTTCPGCDTPAVIPTLVIVELCPHCDSKLKFTPELKGERLDCTHCRQEVTLPGAVPGGELPARLVDFACPKCGADIEALEGKFNEFSPCPNCGAEVHFRRKLHLRLESDLRPAEPPGAVPPTEAPSLAHGLRSRLSQLLRYGILDLFLLLLMCLPLPALDGHNFFYILRLSLTGSKLESTKVNPAPPAPIAQVQLVRSDAWKNGYEKGQVYGKMDHDGGRTEYREPTSVMRAHLAGGYANGSSEYSDFWDGYRQGYFENR